MDGCHGPGRVPALSKPPPIAPLEIAVASITEGSEWHESLAAAIRRRVRFIPAPLDRGLLGVLLGGDCWACIRGSMSAAPRPTTPRDIRRENITFDVPCSAESWLVESLRSLCPAPSGLARSRRFRPTLPYACLVAFPPACALLYLSRRPSKKADNTMRSAGSNSRGKTCTLEEEALEPLYPLE